MRREWIPLRRLVIFSAVLILIGLSPPLVGYVGDRLPALSDIWLAKISVVPLLNHLSDVWTLVSAKSYLLRYFGIALLVGSLAWAVVRYRKADAHTAHGEPDFYVTSGVLLTEAEAIDGRKPDEVTSKNINAFAEALVLEEERGNAILRPDGSRNSGFNLPCSVSPALYRWLNNLDRSALCLSGGGIRSASFGLGALQALASYPGRASPGRDKTQEEPELAAGRSFLAQIQYLSTVSGGGYIGSWLSAWRRRHGFVSVWKDLVRVPSDSKDPGEEPGAIQWLRDHSNYLTPRLGLTSPDTLAGIAIFIRNLLLNWLILLPFLFAALLVVKTFELLVFFLSTYDRTGPTPLRLFGWLAAVGLVAKFITLRFRLRNRASMLADKTMWERQANQAKVIRYGLVPLMVAAFAFILCLALASAQAVTTAQGRRSYTGWVIDLFADVMKDGIFLWPDILGIGAVCGTLLYAISWLAAWPRVHGVREFWRWTVSGAIYGTMVSAIIYFFSRTEVIDWSFYTPTDWVCRPHKWWFCPEPASVTQNRHSLALIYLGVPMLMAAQMMAEMIFLGLQSEEPDDDREWLGRAAGLVLLSGVGWLIIVFLTCVGSDVAVKTLETPANWLVLAGVYIGGTVAAAIGRSARVPAQGQAAGAKSKSTIAAATTMAVIFAVVLVVVASAAIDLIVLGRPIASSDTPDQQREAILPILKALALMLVIGVIASRTINVNRFSMHALYRNRLIRTFLGASVEERHPNLFTEFDNKDNMRMHELWEEQKGEGLPSATNTGDPWRPFHIVNMALNVSSSDKRLSWQERKASSFTASPLHCGSSYTGFRSSKTYGAEQGMSLGTAIAISGAAASPNQGYSSSPALAFLMTLFNVRLGWWLGNPGPAGEETYTHDGPKTAVRSMLAELLGMTRDDQPYIYLSDGGHFENLGLYEMVRRRCRFIIVSDAGCDPTYTFEDLGNAVRKIQIDLGVRIRFFGLEKLKPRSKTRDDISEGPYHAIGDINYSAVDGPGVERGIILYIKPGYHGTENSAGIRSYAATNTDFPHDDTANQFYGESQLESYRALGFEIVDLILQDGVAKAMALRGKVDDATPATHVSLKEVMLALHQSASGRSSPLPLTAPGR
jgi:Patatin-like phospholipase